MAQTSGLADRKGTMEFQEYMSNLEIELEKLLADNYTHQPDWTKRWLEIVNGSRTVMFKFAWHPQRYMRCEQYAKFSDEWWAEVPTPLRVKYLSGNAGVPMDSDARGFPLPSDFAETLLHYTHIRHPSSIANWGIKTGVNCGMSSGNCVHLSADEYDTTIYRRHAQLLAQGDLELPCCIGFPPQNDHNAKVVVNYTRLYNREAELAEDESFTITCKAGFDVPWSCRTWWAIPRSPNAMP